MILTFGTYASSPLMVRYLICLSAKSWANNRFQMENFFVW